jgi:hypothetical protein
VVSRRARIVKTDEDDGFVGLADGKHRGRSDRDKRESMPSELIGHGSDLPLGHLGLQRLQQDRDGSLGAGEICCVSSATLMPLKY